MYFANTQTQKFKHAHYKNACSRRKLNLGQVSIFRKTLDLRNVKKTVYDYCLKFCKFV